MKIITLISDWKPQDYYLAILKGHLYSTCNEVVIVDISHNITTFNIQQAAFILRETYKAFPVGTIHLLCVKTGIQSTEKHAIAEHNGHYFIGTDNGIFSLLFNETPEKFYAINSSQERNIYNTTFAERSVFAEAAAFIFNGRNISDLGEIIDAPKRAFPLFPTYDNNFIIGHVVYIDTYSNIITNISKDLFDKLHKNRAFKIYVNSNRNVIKKISTNYNETEAGELFAIFNYSENLEIGIREGNAAELLGLNTNSTVRINFS